MKWKRVKIIVDGKKVAKEHRMKSNTCNIYFKRKEQNKRSTKIFQYVPKTPEIKEDLNLQN